MRLYTTEEDEVNCESWRLLAGWVILLSSLIFKLFFTVLHANILLPTAKMLKKATMGKNLRFPWPYGQAKIVLRF